MEKEAPGDSGGGDVARAPDFREVYPGAGEAFEEKDQSALRRMRPMIPLHKVWMAKGVDRELKGVLHSGFIGEGPQVKAFESLLSSMYNLPNALAVN